MGNTKEDIALIQIKKDRLAEINTAISELNREKAWVNQEILRLDVVKKTEYAKARSKQKYAIMVKKQDQIVTCLEHIGKTTTAGPICNQLKKIFGLDLHNNFFAGMFLEHVLKDKRVIVTKINTRKNEYSLVSWTKNE